MVTVTHYNLPMSITDLLKLYEAKRWMQTVAHR